MKVLAVTGGIGSGKSHIVKIFSALGIPVYLADDRTKALYDQDKDLLRQLVTLLGGSIIVEGKLQKSVMAGIIFNDRNLLEGVEKIVHPFVVKDFLSWKRKEVGERTPFVIFESAIFLEKPPLLSLADKVLTVSAPIELRRERISKRDNLSEEQINSRVENQWSDAEREAKADYVIYSDENSALLPQVLSIFNEMTR